MKPLLVIAGAGQTGRELAVRMLPGWRIAVIDRDPVKLAQLAEEAGQADISGFQGDATSTLVLKSAGIASAQGALAVTSEDPVNLEFCRLAKELFRVPHVLAVANLRGAVSRFGELGVPSVSRPHAIASVLESRFGSGRRTTADVGLGQGEILEVTVLPHSPVVGKALSELRPQSWVAGAIYRKGRLVVPHGSTVVQEGDRVLLIGQPDLLPPIADYIRSGTSRFPLQYGSRLVLALPPGMPEEPAVSEAVHLLENTRAAGITLMGGSPDVQVRLRGAASGSDLLAWSSSPMDALSAVDYGCLVLPAAPVRLRERLGFGGGPTMGLIEGIRQPCLVARGTHPYRRILLVASPGPGPSRAVGLALDMSRLQDASLTAIAVLPPSFVTGQELHDEILASLDRAVNVGTVYSKEVEVLRLEGNPVHQILSVAGEFDLLVLAHRRRRSFRPTHPDLSRHLLLRAPCSTMVLPYDARAQDGS